MFVFEWLLVTLSLEFSITALFSLETGFFPPIWPFLRNVLVELVVIFIALSVALCVQWWVHIQQ
jgi:hypothetical protein